MIKFIAAIDNKRGLANDKRIPWDLPTDRKYYHDKITHQTTLVGKGTYHEAPDRHNIVASREGVDLAPGDELVDDAGAYLNTLDDSKDIWVIGGAQIFTSTIDQADELYLTLLDADFGCTKFFPEYDKDFECVENGQQQTENGISFRFTVWRRK